MQTVESKPSRPTANKENVSSGFYFVVVLGNKIDGFLTITIKRFHEMCCWTWQIKIGHPYSFLPLLRAPLMQS